MICVALAAGVLACSRGKGDEPLNPAAGTLKAETLSNRSADNSIARVSAFRVRRQSISNRIHANTALEPYRKVTIHAKLNAIVESLLVEEGTNIRKGQVLARLDDREIRNEYLQSEIAVEQAELTQRQAQARANLSATIHERTLAAFAEKLVSKAQVDEAAFVREIDDLASQAAQRQHDVAKARLEAARIQLEGTEISSSIDGVLTERLIAVGDRVDVLQPVFTVAEFFPLQARVFVPAADANRLNVGQEAAVQLEIFPDQAFTGAIKMINPTVDAASGTVKVTIEIQQNGNRLRPGLFGTVSISTRTKPGAIVVPNQSVIREGDRTSVFVIRPANSVEKRDVVPGLSEGGWTEILEGVIEGEAVVTEGQDSLTDGHAVQILD